MRRPADPISPLGPSTPLAAASVTCLSTSARPSRSCLPPRNSLLAGYDRQEHRESAVDKATHETLPRDSEKYSEGSAGREEYADHFRQTARQNIGRANHQHVVSRNVDQNAKEGFAVRRIRGAQAQIDKVHVVARHHSSASRITPMLAVSLLSKTFTAYSWASGTFSRMAPATAVPWPNRSIGSGPSPDGVIWTAPAISPTCGWPG